MVQGAGSFTHKEVNRARRGDFKVHQRYVHLDPPVNWARDPYHSRRFRGALNDFAWMDVLFYDFRHNHRLASLRQARSLAVDWIRSNPPGDGATDRTWDDRISATRATRLAYAMRASDCRGVLNARKRRAFRGSLLVHGKLAASSRHYRPTNHGLYVDTNLILLARAVPHLAKGRGWQGTGVRRFKRTLRGRMFEHEGMWLEHSTAYQLAIRRQLEFFRDLVGDDGLGPLLARMTDVAGWMVEPDRQLLLLGSTNYKRPPGAVRDAAEAQHGIAWLPRSGFAAVKGSGAYLSLAATFFNASHKHSDDLSFDLYDAGRRIVSDSGQFDKDPGRWGDFGESPFAHSTLTVDGRRFSRNPRDAYDSGLLARGEGDGWYAILARNPLVGAQGVDHRRLLLFKPGLGLLVADRVRSRHRHTYTRYVQLARGIDARRKAGGAALSSGGWDGRLDDETAHGRPRLTLVRGRRRPAILGFEFPGFRQRKARFTAVMRTHGEDLDHLAALGLDGSQPLDARLRWFRTGAAEIRLGVGGAAPASLRVERHGRRLEVREEP